VIIVWSEILPRDWGVDTGGLSTARTRINTYAVKCVKKGRGLLYQTFAVK